MTDGTDGAPRLTRKELAEVLGTNPRTINGWVAKALLVAFPAPLDPGETPLRYDARDVQNWLASQSAMLAEKGHPWWSEHFARFHERLTGFLAAG